MKPHHLCVFALGMLVLVATGCAHKPPAADASAPKHWTTVVELPRQTLTFQTMRDDITVGCTIFTLYQADMGKALNLDAVRVNGVKPRSDRLYLKRVGKNQFELPAVKIEFSKEAVGGPLYLALKVWFNELTNQEDSAYYQRAHATDRYALLSYCTQEDEDPAKVNARLGANRVKTVKEFKARLAQPFVINLNQQPLRAGLGHWPMINNGGRELSEADLKTIEQLVRERGERFLIAISANGRDRAVVGVGDHDLYEGKRRYDLGRTNGTWRIEKVEQRESGW